MNSTWRRFAKNVAKTTGVIVATPILASLGYASFEYATTPKDQISLHHTPYSIYYQSITNLFMSKLGSYAKKNYDKVCENAAKENEELLLRLLDRCKDTVYGKDFNLGEIKSREEFVKKHPITTHDHYESYIERVYNGEENIMFPDRPRMIGTTSGTSGSQKMIPVPGLQRSVFFTKGIALTFDALCNGVKHGSNPNFHYPNLQKSCKLMHEPNFTYTDNNIKVGPNSSSPKDNKGLLELYTTPGVAFDVQNEKELMFLHVLFALLDSNLGFIEANFANRVWNFFVLLEEEWPILMESIERGHLPSDLNIDPNIRKQLNQKLRANKHRALELKRIKKDHDENKSSTSLARKIWVSTKQYNNLWF